MRNRSVLLRMITLMAVLALSLVVAGAATDPFKDLEIIRLPGDPAKEFSLPDLNGRTVSLKDYRGKVLLLYFWATW
jgi:cytochrome oxidase Cu insertion factor (SCO1/SenC/PrrC family)